MPFINIRYFNALGIRMNFLDNIIILFALANNILNIEIFLENWLNVLWFLLFLDEHLIKVDNLTQSFTLKLPF
jgi:hypothetical protein